MSVGAAIRARTQELPAVTAIVGARVHPLRLPRDPVLPAITYRRVSAARVRSHSGPSGLARPRYQLDCWANDPDTAEALADAIRKGFDAFRGGMGSLVVGSSFVENEIDDVEPNTGLFRRIVDVQLSHQEAT